MININYLKKELVNSEIELKKLKSNLTELSKLFKESKLSEGSLKIRTYKTGKKTIYYQYYDENHTYQRIIVDSKNPESIAIYANCKNTYFTKMKVNNLEHYIIGLKSLIKHSSIICSNNKIPEAYMIDINSITNKSNSLNASKIHILSNKTSHIIPKIASIADSNTHTFSNTACNISDANLSNSDTNSFWDSLIERSNAYLPENLICKGYKGFYRSKSEAAISVALYKNNIEFKYEPCITIENRTYYPDFVLLSPLANELIIWEHFGCIDDKEYNIHAKKKINAYESVGFYINRNFIITCETKKKPFTEIDVQNALNFINNI